MTEYAITTTLAAIRDCEPCVDGWKKLLVGLGVKQANEKTLPLERILEINGLYDALWVLETIDGYKNSIRLYACHCARYSLVSFERVYPGDKRPRLAIETAENFALGRATEDESFAAGGLAFEAYSDAAGITGSSSGASLAARAAANLSILMIECGALTEVLIDALEAVRIGVGNGAKAAAKADFTREFIRLCRLEGKYGKVARELHRKNFPCKVT